MYSKNFIQVVQSQFKGIQQPYKVGETITVSNIKRLIIGIQRFHYNAQTKTLHVRYITQSLEENYQYPNVDSPEEEKYIKGWFSYKTEQLERLNSENIKEPLKLHDLIYSNKTKSMLKVMEIVDIEFMDNEIKVWVNLLPIVPVEVNEDNYFDNSNRMESSF